MINTRDIREFFRQYLIDSALIPEADIHWEQRKFDPDTKTPFVSEVLLPGDEGVANRVQGEAVGIINYEVYVRKKSGTEVADDLASDISSLYSPASMIDETWGSLRITVDRSETGVHREEAKGWYVKPARITYRVVEDF